MQLKRFAWAVILAALLLLLSGCTPDDVTKPADTTVDISLPYATVTPSPSDEINSLSALVITEEGDVYLRDISILDESADMRGLKVGNSGEEVLELEKRLYQLNYMDSKPDGVFDEETETAVKRFARTVTAGELKIATSELIEALDREGAPVYGTQEYYEAIQNPYTALQKGDRSAGVRRLRERLSELGYPVAGDDDLYDDMTEEAVRLFFREYGRDDCLVATVAMQKQLYAEGARHYTPVSEEQISREDPELLELGSVGSRVSSLERQLMYLGYPDIDVDGVYDMHDFLAVARIQNLLGLDVTGKVPGEMYGVLMCAAAPSYSDTRGQDENGLKELTVLTQEDHGIDVQRQQLRLKELGYIKGNTTGKYDAGMEKAIARFRCKAGLRGSGPLNLYETALLYWDDVPGYNGVTAFERAAILSYDGSCSLGLLGPESSGHAVFLINQKLTALGYLEGNEISDVFTEETRLAVMLLQERTGAEQTGEVTGSMYRFLACARVPAADDAGRGAGRFRDMDGTETGYTVLRLQRALIRDGYLTYNEASSRYDDATRSGVRQVQKDMGYAVTDGLMDACMQGLYVEK